MTELEDEPWFRRAAVWILAVRFVGFWATLVLLVWLFGWITLPPWLVWALAAPALFTVFYAVLHSIVVHRRKNFEASAGTFYAAVVAVIVFWAAVIAGILWWWPAYGNDQQANMSKDTVVDMSWQAPCSGAEYPMVRCGW